MFKALPFLPKRHEGDELLPVVIAVMTFLSVLTLSGTLAMGRGLDAWSRSLDDRITIQITAANSAQRDTESENALRMLQASPDVSEARILAKSEVLELISPWLGDLPTGTDLPVPTLIAVTLRPDTIGNLEGLKERLSRVAPSSVLDDHQAWLGSLLSLASFVRLLLGVALAMVLLSTAAIVIFGCRAGLAAHNETISIMHSMGATDYTISAAFERRYLVHGIKGGAYGGLTAGIVLWGLGSTLGALAGGLITALFPGLPSPLWLFAVPLAIASLTTLTARTTVLGSLKKMV